MLRILFILYFLTFAKSFLYWHLWFFKSVVVLSKESDQDRSGASLFLIF